MILSFENIAHYLLVKGLIEPESIIKGEFSVRDFSSRNVNYIVNKEYTTAYLLKQVRSFDKEKCDTLRIEATCYWLANNDEAYNSLHDFLPGFIDFDYLNNILILEYLKNVRNLHEFYRDDRMFSEPIAEKLADLLVSFHTHESDLLETQKSYSLFKKRKPWVFTLSKSNLSDWLNDPTLDNAEKQSVELILNSQEFLDNLQHMEESWEVKSLIHGDIKFPNILIDKDYIIDSEPEIRLIDWELADIGDPLWDVAAIFQNYLSLWVASEIEQKYQKQEPSNSINIEMIQPSISAFWQRYTGRIQWNDATASIYLKKTVQFTALKLIHTCFESIKGVKDMSLYSAKILQLSLNMLLTPVEAINDVLGIKTLATNKDINVVPQRFTIHCKFN